MLESKGESNFKNAEFKENQVSEALRLLTNRKVIEYTLMVVDLTKKYGITATHGTPERLSAKEMEEFKDYWKPLEMVLKECLGGKYPSKDELDATIDGHYQPLVGDILNILGNQAFSLTFITKYSARN